MVMETLESELKEEGKIHALALKKLWTPEQYQKLKH